MAFHIDKLSQLVRSWHSAHEIMGAVGSYVDGLPRQYVMEWLMAASANYPPGDVRAFGLNLSLAGGRSAAGLTVAASVIVVHKVRSR
jgi:hypothetical protein